MFRNFASFLKVSTLITVKRLNMSSVQNLKGKTAIVTASTEGIGFSIAKRLAQNGASVIISSRKENNVKKAVEELKKCGLDVEGTVCHVGKEEDRKHLVQFALDKKGAIDILVSNAGINPYFGAFLDTPEEIWKKIFDVNVVAAFMITKEVVPQIEKRGGGSVIYISSIGGYQPFELLGSYSVSKTALLGLTKTMAMTCAPMNIRVNCIAPGLIKTKFSQALTSNEHLVDELRIPLRRVGEPDDIGGVAAFLCSDDASYITGECVAVTGGIYAHL
ncbi:dehydrogenase/reductase SDR family member 4-like [Centruroides vittatus]|uniref:dehydrogenase/reductase SDR family member 4-like n=1 Tax=Centruroides vittatus TaxID=120091 RepID=UPI00350FA651